MAKEIHVHVDVADVGSSVEEYTNICERKKNATLLARHVAENLVVVYGNEHSVKNEYDYTVIYNIIVGTRYISSFLVKLQYILSSISNIPREIIAFSSQTHCIPNATAQMRTNTHTPIQKKTHPPLWS